MGKATIISETGAGLYVIKPLYDNDFINSQISSLTSNISTYSSNISSIEAEQDLIETEYDDKQEELNAAIDDLNADFTPEKLEEVAELTSELGVILKRLSASGLKLSREKLKKASAEKRKTKLENIVSDVPNRNAWNVAYVEGLTGEVNTIEINGEADEILIGTFLGASKLTEILGQTVAGSLYNFSLFPYWQKWNPTFRTGTITSISGDYADVTLDAAFSAYQDLAINQTGSLSNVEIVYLTCNGAAFNVGDDVIVGFTDQDWSTPVIIGFRDNPKRCGTGVVDIGYNYPAGIFGTLSPLNWSAVDIGGVSPDVSVESATTVPSFGTNKIENFFAGTVSYSATTTNLVIFTVTVTMNFDYDGTFTLEFKETTTEASATSWTFFVSDTDGLNPGLSLSGPGLSTNLGPLYYVYLPGQYVSIDNYSAGRLYVEISHSVNIPGYGNNSVIHSNFDNFKETILGL